MGNKEFSTELEIYINVKRLLCIERLNYSKDRILLSPARKKIFDYIF